MPKGRRTFAFAEYGHQFLSNRLVSSSVTGGDDMRLSIILLLCSLAGVLLGASLIGIAALGAAVIFDSLCVGVWALSRDDGLPAVRPVRGTPTVAQALERFRDAA